MSHESNGSADRLDLSPLDPLADDASLARFVERVRLAATPELMRRQTPSRLGDLIVRMRRPILAASGLLAAVSILVLWTGSLPRAQSRDAVATALGVPGDCADWVYAARRPSVGDLLGGSGRKP